MMKKLKIRFKSDFLKNKKLSKLSVSYGIIYKYDWLSKKRNRDLDIIYQS